MRRLSLLLLPLAALSAAPAGAADSMGQVLETIERRETVPRPSVPEAPLQTPSAAPQRSAAEGRRVLVGQFRVTGNTLLPDETLRGALAPLEGHELTFAEIQGAADLVTARYRAAGYLLAQAFLPAQEVGQGVVEIRVVEGRIGRVEVSGNRRTSTDFVARRFAPLTAAASPTQAEVERPLLLLNEHLGLRARASFKAGQAPGTADLLVTVAETPPYAAQLSFDNFGSPDTSRRRLTARAETGSLLADGDDLTLLGVSGVEWGSLLYGKAEYSAPLGSGGTRLAASGGYSRYESDVGGLAKWGEAAFAGLELSHPLVRTRARSLDALLRFDARNVGDHLELNPSQRDRLRTVQLGFSSRAADPFGGRWWLAVADHQGIAGFPGGTRRGDVHTSRDKGDPGFNKLTLDAARYQDLPGRLLLTLRAAGQGSGDRLFSAEQFSLGGQGTVRGQEPGTHSADSGYAVGVELEAPVPWLGRPGTGGLRAAVFADHGAVRRNHPEPGESRIDRASGAGAGLRASWGPLSARLEWAAPLGQGWIDTDRRIVSFQASASF